MKLFFVLISIAIAIVIGFYYLKGKIKPFIYGIFVSIFMAITIFLAFLPNLDVNNTKSFFTLPSIPNYGDLIRIFNFHIPIAWVSVLAYLISMLFSIIYLRTRDLSNDIKASSSALIGTIFCLLTTITGMLWAKSTWGSYWNWDPREISIFILLLIYAAYFALRSALDNQLIKARLSSVYSIVAFFSVPVLVFILPRTSSGLHPGSLSDGNSSIGPVIDTSSGMVNDTLLLSMCFGFFSFTLLFFWLLSIHIKFNQIKKQIELMLDKDI